MDKIQILLLSANPNETDELSLIEECKQISRKIESATFGNQFKLEQEHKVSVKEIQELLSRRYTPQIVHFAGHGEKGFLLLQDDEGNIEEAKLKPFVEMFRILNNRANISKDSKIRLVILNACYTNRIAKAVAEHVDFVIGMSNAVDDNAARTFSQSFYYHICSGSSIKDALEFAKNQIDYLGLKGQARPKLKIIRSEVDSSESFIESKAPSNNVDFDLDSISTVDYLKTLSKYFITNYDLRMLCARMRKKGVNELRLDLAEITGADVPKMLFNIIEYCEARGKIEALLSSALEERPTVPELLELARKNNGG